MAQRIHKSSSEKQFCKLDMIKTHNSEIVNREAKKKQAIRDERVSNLQVGPLKTL